MLLAICPSCDGKGYGESVKTENGSTLFPTCKDCKGWGYIRPTGAPEKNEFTEFHNTIVDVRALEAENAALRAELARARAWSAGVWAYARDRRARLHYTAHDAVQWKMWCAAVGTENALRMYREAWEKEKANFPEPTPEELAEIEREIAEQMVKWGKQEG